MSWECASCNEYICARTLLQGTPGTYLHIYLPTGAGNITFSLPMSLRAWPYGGDSQVAGFTRCAYTYGPLLMAVQGPWNATAGTQQIVGYPSDLSAVKGSYLTEGARDKADGGYIVLAGLDPATPESWAARRPGNSLVFDISPDGPGAGYTLVPYYEIQVSGGCANPALTVRCESVPSAGSRGAFRCLPALPSPLTACGNFSL